MAAHFRILVSRIPWTEEPWRATVSGIAESDVTERLTLRLLVSFKSSISLLIFLLAFYLLLNVEY